MEAQTQILNKEQFADLQSIQKARTNVAVKRWEKVGLLNGLDENKKRSMAVLLENQFQHLKDQKLLTEASLTQASSGGEGWSNVAMPLVRKVFANLIANEIISVQPMSLPSGLVFYLDYRFGTTGSNEKDGRTTGDSLYGNTTSSGQVSGGYYGGVDYSYTKNFLSGNLGPFTTGASLTATGSNAYCSASWADLDYDINFSASATIAATTLKKVIIPAASMSNVDETWAKAITLSGGSVSTQYRKFTKYDASNSTFTFIISGAHAPAIASSDITGSWIRKNTESFRGDFEIGQTGTGTNPIPEVNIAIYSKGVIAGTRKLKAKWTPELQQDFAAYHDVDAEKELTNIMGEQVSLEIDREILDKLLTNGESVTKLYWSKNIGTFVNAAGGVLAGTGTFYGTQNEWYQTLVETINFASNMIKKKTLRGAGNFIVTSPEVCSVLESVQNFRPIMSFGEKDTKFSYGVEKAGVLSSRWTVYNDPYFQTNKILIGYKGNSFLENGFVYSPYVPLVLTPTVLDPDTLNPVKGIMTRYATTTVRPEFYAAVVIRDMQTPTVNKYALPV